MTIFYFSIIQNKKNKIVELKVREHNLNHFLNYIIKKQQPLTNKQFQYKDQFTFHTIFPNYEYLYICISLNDVE